MGDAYERYKRLRAQEGSSPAPSFSGPQEGSDKSIWDFGENIAGGFKDLGQGLTGLFSTVGHDLAGLVTEAKGEDADFLLDDLLKQAAFDWEGLTPGKVVTEGLQHLSNPLANPRFGRVFKDDYSRRYGPLLPGGDPAGETAEHAYNEPLSFLLDALDAATLGGTAAAGAARRVSRIGSVTKDLERLGGGVTDVSPVAKVVDKILPGRKYQEVGEDFAEGGTTKAMDPTTGRLHVTDYSSNPIRRGLREKPLDRWRTEPVEKLDDQIRQLDELIEGAEHGDTVTEWIAQRDLLKNFRAEANDQAVTRILKPSRANKLNRKRTQQIDRDLSSHFYGHRDKLIDEHNDVLGSIDAPDSVKLNVLLGFDERPGARVTFDEVERVVNDAAAVAASPRLTRVAEVVQPWVKRVREMETEFQDLNTVRSLPIGRKVEADFMDRLNKEGRFADVPAGARRYVLEEPERRALDDELRMAAGLELDAARRFIEIVGGEPLGAARRGLDDEVGDWLDDNRLLNLEREASVLLRTGGDFSTLFETLYKPLRIKAYIDNGLDTIDDAPTARELDDMRKAGQVKAPAYYPQESRLSQQKSDYLLKNSVTYGATKRAKPKAFRQNRGKNMEIWLRENLDAFELNPQEAYARMASQVAGYETMLRKMDYVRREFGIPITSREELPSSWKIINPEAVRILFHKHRDAQLRTFQEAVGGADEADAISRAMFHVFDDIDPDLEQLFLKRGEVYAVPEVVADALQESIGKLINPKLEKLLRFTWDGYMKMWRDLTLYLRGAFYLNNTVGNSTFLNLQGGKLRKVAQQLDRGYKAKMKDTIAKLGATEDVDTGMLSTALMRSTSLEPYRGTRMGDFAIGVNKSKPAKVVKAPIKGGQRLNGIIENAFRRESFMTAAEKHMARHGIRLVGNKFLRSQRRLDQILKYGAENPQAVRRWIDEMNDYMNDYANQSPFVRRYVRRFAAPFWPFYRHAAKILVTMPFEHPLKATVLTRLNDMNEEYVQDTLGMVPEWLETARPVGEGNEPGETTFMNPRATNPFEALTDNPLGLIGPLGSIILESATGRDTFTGKKFTSPDTYAPWGSEVTRDAEGNPTKVVPILDAPLEALLNQIPAYGTVRNLLPGAGARYSTGQTIEDEFGNPKYPTDKGLEVLRLLGVPLTQFNLGAWQAQEAEERALAREALARRNL